MRSRIASVIFAVTALSLLGLRGQPVRAAGGGSTNLLRNAGFEEDALGLAGKVPAGWAKSYGDPAVLGIVAEPRPASPGDKALKIGSNETFKRGGVLSELMPLNPLIPLKVSLWLKDGGDMDVNRQPYVGVAWYDAQGEPIALRAQATSNYVYLNYPRMPDWQLVSRVLHPFREDEKDATKRHFSIPGRAAFFQVRVFTSNYPWPVWVDDALAVQTRPPTRPQTGATRNGHATSGAHLPGIVSIPVTGDL